VRWNADRPPRGDAGQRRNAARAIADAPSIAPADTQPEARLGTPSAPPVHTARRHGLFLPASKPDVLPYLAPVGLAGAAAWYSIRGMVVLFPGSAGVRHRDHKERHTPTFRLGVQSASGEAGFPVNSSLLSHDGPHISQSKLRAKTKPEAAL
jgi:hypothetical protein